ncbi:MAG: type VI secretion system protein TssA [Gemmatimonas sp.]|nr:type VI secretion system protein TssA [Gemmatimonas sp.]
MPLHISELLEPIPGSAPGGTYLRYDPVYDRIQQARIEEDELPSGEWQTERRTADYALVVKLAREVLASRSKDLQIAAWLTEGLLKREGFGGLRDGLELTRRLLEEFWDDLHPELEDGDAEFRSVPLDWLGQYTDRAVRLMPVNQVGHSLQDLRDSQQVGYEEDADTYAKRDERKALIEAGKITAEGFDEGFNVTETAWYRGQVGALDGALAALEALDSTCVGRFGSEAPRFTPLREAIEEVRRTMVQLLERRLDGAEPEPVPEEVAVPETEGSRAEGAAAGSAGVPSVAVPAVFAGPSAASVVAAMPKGRGAAESSIAAAARTLRSESRSNPGSYLMLRGLRWGELRANGRDLDPMLLVAPPTEVRTRVKSLLLEEKWEELLDSAEEVMATPFGRGWLDLQRYVVTACDALGGEYAVLGAAIRGSLRSLLEDLPDIAAHTMTDDSPTANAETRAWSRQEGLLPEVAEDAEDEMLPPRPRPRQDVLARATELAKSGKSDRAVELLMSEAAQERSPRGRFLRRTQAAALLVEAGKEAVAMPILEQLVEQIEQHELERWEEAETIAQPLGLLYRCRVAIEGNGSSASGLFERVCRLDPMQALRIGPAPAE